MPILLTFHCTACIYEPLLSRSISSCTATSTLIIPAKPLHSFGRILFQMHKQTGLRSSSEIVPRITNIPLTTLCTTYDDYRWLWWNSLDITENVITKQFYRKRLSTSTKQLKWKPVTHTIKAHHSKTNCWRIYELFIYIKNIFTSTHQCITSFSWVWSGE